LILSDAFQVHIAVRAYELDARGHVNGTVYLQYGEHARWECLRAAGISQDGMLRRNTSPVRLEETVRYHRELRAGDEVDVTCTFLWGEGKTFQVLQDIRRTDGVLAAEVTNVGGVLDLTTRRLLPDPASHFRSLATAPEVLGL
jgi:acyl-CoA thioester hydrolase